MHLSGDNCIRTEIGISWSMLGALGTQSCSCGMNGVCPGMSNCLQSLALHCLPGSGRARRMVGWMGPVLKLDPLKCCWESVSA